MRKLATILGALTLVVTACSADPVAETTTTTTVAVTPTTAPTPPTTAVVDLTSDTTTLTVWVPAALVDALTEAAAGFEIETGIAIEAVAVETDGMLDTLLADPAAGPDVFIGPHRWLLPLTGAGVAEPVLVDSSVVAGAAAGVTYRGSGYAAPVAVDTLAQFRNPQLLAAAPETAGDLAAGCDGAGDEVVPCLVLPTASAAAMWAFATALGGYVFGPDEFAGWDKDDVGVDADEAVAGATVLEEILEGAGILDDGDSTARRRFAAGEAALYWGTIADMEALRDAGVTFEVDALPTIDGAPASGPVDSMALWVNAFSPDKEAAVRLVEDHLARPDAARLLAAALRWAPADDGPGGDTVFAPFTAAAATGLPLPPIAATEIAWEELGLAFQAMRAGQSAADALSGAASTIRAGA